MKTTAELDEFISNHRLPASFQETVTTWFQPLAEQLAGNRAEAGRSLLVGVNGSQGSGKSTLAAVLVRLLAGDHGLRAISLSLDDFYLSHDARKALALQVHPLLAVRGVPGTHDVRLMIDTLKHLTSTGCNVAVPRFDKAADTRLPESEWEQVTSPFDVVIVEGWCLGTPPQPAAALEGPVNELEAREDPHGDWRRFVNRQISEHYQALYALVDIWVLLQAPSFECVYGWRREQEQKLACRVREQGRDVPHESQVMDDEQLERFIQHYQRLTEHALAVMPQSVHYLFRLDKDRNFRALERPKPLIL